MSDPFSEQNTPSGWLSSVLGDVATLQRGFDLPIQNRTEGRHPVYGSNGIDGFNDDAMLPGPGVITGRSGTIGLVHYEQAAYWPLNTTLYVKDFHGNDERYIYYFLQTLDLGRFAAATGVPSLNRNFVHPFPVVMPPLSEQRKIARILTAVDKLTEKTDALIAKYQAIKQGMMHDLFTRGVDEDGHLRPPYEDAPKFYKQSELGWIPKEWQCVRCTEVCREIVVGIVIQPTQYYASEGVPVLRSANVRESGILGTDLVFMSEESNRRLAKSMLRTGDVVTVRTGYPGTSCVVSPEYNGSNCVDVIISRPGPKIRSEFLATWINSDSGKNQVLRKQGGLAQQHFNVGELKDLRVALPSLNEQALIESALFTQKSTIQAEERHQGKLLLLKTGLIQDLLTGKVRVKVDEAEEVHIND
jgi:type I restriction enzyme, S subunit